MTAALKFLAHSLLLIPLPDSSELDATAADSAARRDMIGDMTSLQLLLLPLDGHATRILNMEASTWILFYCSAFGAHQNQH